MSSQLLGLTGMEDGTSAGYLLRLCSRSMRRSTFAPIRRALGRAPRVMQYREKFAAGISPETLTVKQSDVKSNPKVLGHL